MCRRIIDENIARQVEHLNALIPDDMESLTRLVGGEGAVFPTRMPIGIDHRATQQVVLGLQPLALPVYLEHRCPMITTDVEDELLGIRLIRTVAVDAHAWHLGVLDDGILVEVGQVALVESHLAIDLIAWGDTAIGQSPFVEGVWTDINLEVLVLPPLAFLLDADGEGQLSPFVLGNKLVPVFDIEISEITLRMQFSALVAFDDYIDTADILLQTVEIQRRHLRRNGHADIVGIDGGELIHRNGVLHPLGARCQTAYEGTKIPRQFSHLILLILAMASRT